MTLDVQLLSCQAEASSGGLEPGREGDQSHRKCKIYAHPAAPNRDEANKQDPVLASSTQLRVKGKSRTPAQHQQHVATRLP